jgi:recombinational DNA repair protein (RecF pathway)
VGEAVCLIEQVARESNWSQSSKSKLYALLNTKLLPTNNVLPASSNDAAKLLAGFGVGYKISPCCPNDCMVFTGSNSILSNCAVCQAASPDGNSPAKQYRHVSLTSTLQQLFQTKISAMQMRAPLPNLDLLSDVWGEKPFCWHLVL